MTSSAPSHLPDTLQEIWDIRARKRDELRRLGFDPYCNVFGEGAEAAQAAGVHRDAASLEAGETSALRVALRGRIQAIRNSGLFIDIEDVSGRIQCFFHKANLSEREMAAVKLLDLGDIIGVTGIVRRTPRGEVTVNADGFAVLAKALLPLPDKHHGLQDQETRLRKRHLDLIANAEARQALRLRALIIKTIRRILDDRGFMEAETPMLSNKAGGASANPFVTHHDALGQDMFLRIAPELHLKRLLVGGVADKLYELGRNFRNEGVSYRHNPEFTSLEVYQAGGTMEDAMALTSSIFCGVADAIGSGREIPFGDRTIFLSGNFPKRRMDELVLRDTGIDFLILTRREAVQAARRAGVDIPETASWGEALIAAFETAVEPHLVQPVHVTGFPAEVSPLARRMDSDARLTDRFETYMAGMELANGFSELNDPAEQALRFSGQSGPGAHSADDDFVEALAQGMPPAAGLGIGIDRLVMLFCNCQHIRDVIAFPALREKE